MLKYLLFFLRDFICFKKKTPVCGTLKFAKLSIKGYLRCYKIFVLRKRFLRMLFLLPKVFVEWFFKNLSLPYKGGKEFTKSSTSIKSLRVKSGKNEIK